MTSRPSSELRQKVVERAGNRCEYCLVHQDDAIASHQIDHVIAEKHGGPTRFENLALSCILCNLRKGSDLTSLDPTTGVVVTLFNPRLQSWHEHFQLDGPRILGTSQVGRTTVEFLRFNAAERLAERRELLKVRRFPSS